MTNNYNTTTIDTRSLHTVRQDCARLAEALIAAGRAAEIPALIRAGVSVDRIPPAPGANPKNDGTVALSRAPAGGFDPALSARRFAEQMGRAPA